MRRRMGAAELDVLDGPITLTRNLVQAAEPFETAETADLTQLIRFRL